MTQDMIALGYRAVACKYWKWVPGMVAVAGHDHSSVSRVLYGYGHSYVGGYRRDCKNYPHASTGWTSIVDYHQASYASFEGRCSFPDLTDPATLGCLLALVREARGEPTYLPTCLDVHDEAWVVNPPIPWRQTRYESYASVLVAALEAAP